MLESSLPPAPSFHLLQVELPSEALQQAQQALAVEEEEEEEEDIEVEVPERYTPRLKAMSPLERKIQAIQVGWGLAVCPRH